MNGNAHSRKFISQPLNFSRGQSKFTLTPLALTVPGTAAWIIVLLLFLLPLPAAHAARGPEKKIQPALSVSESADKTSDQPGQISPDQTSVDQITVIGSRIPTTAQNLNDAAANVSYKSKKDLNASRPLTFQDAIRDEEGVNFFDNVGNGIESTVTLRGFSSNRIIFLLDGVRVNEIDNSSVSFPLLVMDDMESIQIDRGSASPIYGSDAFAGVVNLTSGRARKKPISQFGGLDWSSWHGLRFYEGVSGTIQDNVTPLRGKWDYYFRGGRNVNDGYRANGGWRMTSFDFKTGYTLPDDKAAVHFGIKHMEDLIHNPGELTFQQFQDNPGGTNKPWDRRTYKNTIIQLSGEAKAWDDKILTQFQSSQRYNTRRSFATSATFGDAQRPGLPNTDFFTLTAKEFDHILQAEYDDLWTKDIQNRSLLGAEFRNGTSASTARDGIGGVPEDNFGTETDKGAHAENFGFFWRETLTLFDKVVPFVGMRHDWHWVDTDNQLNIRQNATERWNASTLSTGLTVHPVDFSDLFFNYSEGFRVPTTDELVPFGGTAASNLRPEESSSYETGTRLRYKDLATTKASFFLIDLKDEIAFDSSAISPAAPTGQNINIGKSRRTGIELRQDIKPLREISFYGSYAWMKAYVRETVAGGVVDGRNFGNVPEHRFTLGGTTTPLARWGEPFDGFHLGVDGIFVGRQHPDSYQSNSQALLNATGGAGHYLKPYSIWNFKASFQWKGQEIFLKINNLFDEKYYSRATNATSFGTVIYPAGSYTFVNPGAPREYVLGSRWEF